jgi:hypothetical protein
MTASGQRATSEFRCAACGYGITVSGALPTCPMCQSTSWNRTRAGSIEAAMGRIAATGEDEGFAAKPW